MSLGFFCRIRDGNRYFQTASEVWQQALRKGIEIAHNCKCGLGCQNCIEPAKSYNISNEDIDKLRGIELANNLLAAVERGPDYQFRNGRMVPL